MDGPSKSVTDERDDESFKPRRKSTSGDASMRQSQSSGSTMFTSIASSNDLNSTSSDWPVIK